MEGEEVLVQVLQHCSTAGQTELSVWITLGMCIGVYSSSELLARGLTKLEFGN